jgi:hypothetical protein
MTFLFLFDLPAFYFDLLINSSMWPATSSIWLRLCVSHTCNSWLRLCIGQPLTGPGLCVCPVVDRLDFVSSIRFFWDSRLQKQLDFCFLLLLWLYLTLPLTQERLHLHRSWLLWTSCWYPCRWFSKFYISFSLILLLSVGLYPNFYRYLNRPLLHITKIYANVRFLLLKALISQVNILTWTLTLLFLQVVIPKFSSSDSLRLRPLVKVRFAASTLFVISFRFPLALLIESF